MFVELEEKELKRETSDYESALRIFEAMWQEAMPLGVDTDDLGRVVKGVTAIGLDIIPDDFEGFVEKTVTF